VTASALITTNALAYASLPHLIRFIAGEMCTCTRSVIEFQLPLQQRLYLRPEPLARYCWRRNSKRSVGNGSSLRSVPRAAMRRKWALQSLGVCRKQTLGPTAAKSHFEPGLTVFCRVTCIFLGLGGLDHILAKRNRSDHQFLTFTTAQRLQLKFLAILVMYNCMRSLLN